MEDYHYITVVRFATIAYELIRQLFFLIGLNVMYEYIRTLNPSAGIRNELLISELCT